MGKMEDLLKENLDKAVSKEEIETVSRQADKYGLNKIVTLAQGRLEELAKQAVNSGGDAEKVGKITTDVNAKIETVVKDAVEKVEAVKAEVPTDVAQEAQSTEKLDPLSQFYQENPKLTEEQKQIWAERFANQRELDKGEHVMVSTSELKVGDIYIEKNKSALKDYLRVLSVNINQGGPNKDSVDIMTEYADGRSGQMGMAIPKTAMLEIVRPVAEPLKEANSVEQKESTETTPEKSEEEKKAESKERADELLRSMQMQFYSTPGALREAKEAISPNDLVVHLESGNKNFLDLESKISEFRKKSPGQLTEDDMGELRSLNMSALRAIQNPAGNGGALDKTIISNLNNKIDHFKTIGVDTSVVYQAMVEGKSIDSIRDKISWPLNPERLIKFQENTADLTPEDKERIIVVIKQHAENFRAIESEYTEIIQNKIPSPEEFDRLAKYHSSLMISYEQNKKVLADQLKGMQDKFGKELGYRE